MINFHTILEENFLELTKLGTSVGDELEYSYFEAWDALQNKTVRVKTHDLTDDTTQVYVAEKGTNEWMLLGIYTNMI